MTDTVQKPAADKAARPAFRPFIPASVVLPELTVLPLVVGALLGVVLAPRRSIWC